MKVAVFVSVLLVNFTYAQEVELNHKTKLNEYSCVETFNGSMTDQIELLKGNLQSLGYDHIESSSSKVRGENFFSKIITGTSMEVHYQVLLLFKEDRYKLIVNGFTIKDQRYGSVKLESLRKKSQARWIALINEKLPSIINNIKEIPSDDW